MESLLTPPTIRQMRTIPATEEVVRHRVHSRYDANGDVFNYIEHFHNPCMRRRLDAQNEAFRLSSQPSVKTG